MNEATNEPEQLAKKQIAVWGWALGVVMVVWFVASIVFGGATGIAQARAFATRNLALGKGIYPAIELYGGDHDGRYPRALLELEPDYLVAGGVESTKYYDKDSKRHYDWLYVQGLSETSPTDWFVLVSPTDQISENRDRRQRLVVCNDGTAHVISAEEFERRFAAQVKAMASQSPPGQVNNNQLSAKHVFGALKAFAEAHNEQYPSVLWELSPDYLAERVGYRDKRTGRQFDWLYVPGLRLTSPADWIVFASPTDEISENPEEHTRLVMTNVGDIAVLPEEEFERKLAAQVKMMAEKTP